MPCVSGLWTCLTRLWWFGLGLSKFRVMPELPKQVVAHIKSSENWDKNLATFTFPKLILLFHQLLDVSLNSLIYLYLQSFASVRSTPFHRHLCKSYLFLWGYVLSVIIVVCSILIIMWFQKRSYDKFDIFVLKP